MPLARILRPAEAGLGGAVAEWLVDRPSPLKARLLRFGTDDRSRIILTVKNGKYEVVK